MSGVLSSFRGAPKARARNPYAAAELKRIAEVITRPFHHMATAAYGFRIAAVAASGMTASLMAIPHCKIGGGSAISRAPSGRGEAPEKAALLDIPRARRGVSLPAQKNTGFSPLRPCG